MKMTLIIFILFIISILSAQSAYWWDNIGSTGTVCGMEIAIDDSLNTYVAGYFAGTLTFYSTVLVSAGNIDIFVAKYDVNGDWQWAVRAGGTLLEYLVGMSVDSSGKVYVTGSFQGTASFGTNSVVSNGSYDIFVAKLDNNGDWIWAVGAGGLDFDMGTCIVNDNSGNVYVTGKYQTSALIGSNLTSAGIDDIFVAKLTGSGQWQWSVSAGGIGSDQSTDIVADNNGNCCITGYFQNQADFGTNSIVSQGNRDVFIAKINSTGTWQWAVGAGGTENEEAGSIAMDANGSCYVTGYFQGTVQFGATTLISLSTGTSDIFVSKIGPAGIWQWAKSCGGYNSDFGEGIGVDNDGNLYITGTYINAANFGEFDEISLSDSHVMFVAKMSSGGNWLWVRSTVCDYAVNTKSIATSGDNTVCVSGYFTGTLDFGGMTLVCDGSSDAFVFKIGDPVPLWPDNINITNLENDIHINWNAVTSDENGYPCTPDYYFVYYSYSQSITGPYYFLDYTPVDIRNYVHQYAGLYSTEYFYNITAVKYYGGNLSRLELDQYLDEHLREGMSKAEVEAVQADINMH